MTVVPEFRYPKVSSREAKRLGVDLSEELLDEVDQLVRRSPALNKQIFWHGALELQLQSWEAEEIEIFDPYTGFRQVKRAGEPFPPHPSPDNDTGGRPSDSELLDRGPTGFLSIRLPPDLAADYKAASYWLSERYSARSYAVEEGGRRHLERIEQQLNRHLS